MSRPLARSLHDPAAGRLSVIPGNGSGVELLAWLRPYVRHCGNSVRDPWEIAERCLLDYLLVYIADGAGRFTVAGTSWDAARGDLFWIPPNTPHAMTGFPPSMHCLYIHGDLLYRPEISHWDFSIPAGMTELPAELRPLLHPPLPDPALAALCGRLRLPNHQRIGALMVDVCAEAARNQPFAAVRMAGLLQEIVAETLRGQTGLAAGYHQHIPQLEKAADWLERHGDSVVGVRQAARVADLSPSHFRQLFTAHFGCAPRDFQRRARIRLAKEWIMVGNLSLSELAFKLGFASVHSFSRAFREIEGVPPGQYRRSGCPSIRVEGRTAPYFH